MAETVNQETNGTAAETQENEQRTFTQAEMNAIIQDRLARERGKYADYEALKAKAAKFDEAEEAGKTELQKANEKADALQKQVDAFTKAEQLRTVRQKVSAATGVPAELLSGDTAVCIASPLAWFGAIALLIPVYYRMMMKPVKTV